MRRIAISVIAAAVLTLGVGVLALWSTAPIRPAAQVTAFADTINQRGLASRIQERLNSIDSSPAEELFQQLTERRNATRSRIRLSLAATFIASFGLIWLASAAADRRTPHRRPLLEGASLVEPSPSRMIGPGSR